MTNHETLMKHALDLARLGSGYTSPNPMVGAVVVNNEIIVGEGYHQAYGQSHAEVNALNQAGEKALGGTLYVTLEPCNHKGRTPPCTHTILDAGISRVIMAMPDPNPQVAGGGADYLLSRGLTVTSGVCETEARQLNEAFITYKTTGKPFVILKVAATLDGRIATRTRDARWVSGPESRQKVHELRHEFDAILVGAGTIHADNPELTARIPSSPDGRPARDPVRVILDTRLSIADSARILHLDSSAETLIVVGKQIPVRRRHQIEKPGVRIIEAETVDDRIDLSRLMPQLGAMGIGSVLIEGGSQVAGSALRAGIVDKVVFFYAPKLTGGDDGVPICKGKGAEMMADCIPLKNLSVERTGDDIMVIGYTD
ncbi:MAG: bifunctional diaminohydroxyphosphoribosylaminopyrimidine deaminase/5-amino-6-(5-phosphoribosylamino)uracil reductase RibD [Desulfatirhabdiaceae bacterium]